MRGDAPGRRDRTLQPLAVGGRRCLHREGEVVGHCPNDGWCGIEPGVEDVSADHRVPAVQGLERFTDGGKEFAAVVTRWTSRVRNARDTPAYAVLEAIDQ